jgi:hypothetical protein
MVASVSKIHARSHSIPISIVEHDSLKEAWDRIRRAHGMHDNNTPKKGVLIHGKSGCGKSYVASQYLALYPPVITESKTIRPVFYFRFKEGQKSISDILKVLIKGLGTTPPKGRPEPGELNDQFTLLIKSLGVELIILDEVQQILPQSEGITALNTLKYFCALLDELNVSIVFIGSTRAMSLITFGQCEKTIDDNEQLSRRMMRPVELQGIEPRTAEWVDCVNWFLKKINFPALTTADSDLLDRIYIAYMERSFSTLESLFLLEDMNGINNTATLQRKLKKNFDIYCKGQFNPFAEEQYSNAQVNETILRSFMNNSER